MNQGDLSHHWQKLKHSKKGFSVIEMMLAIAIFSLFSGGFLLSYIHGQQSHIFGGQRARATYLAEEGLEVVRNMRDESYARLVNGTHGLVILDNQWEFFETSDITDDLFTRQITINQLDPSRKEVISTVTWQQTPVNQASLQLVTHLTDWTD